MRKLYVFLSFLSLIFCSSCNENSNRGKLKYGERCYIREQCFGAIDESSFKELNKISNRRDMVRLQEMILNGSIYILNTSDECTVLELKFGKCKIRVDRGIYPFNVWVSSEFVMGKANTGNLIDEDENEKVSDNNIGSKENKISQAELKKGMLEFKEGESIIGTIWESRSNDIGETFVLNFISKSEATLSSKSLGTRNQTYTYNHPNINFFPEGARESNGYISNSKLTIDDVYTFICIKK